MNYKVRRPSHHRKTKPSQHNNTTIPFPSYLSLIPPCNPMQYFLLVSYTHTRLIEVTNLPINCQLPSPYPPITQFNPSITTSLPSLLQEQHVRNPLSSNCSTENPTDHLESQTLSVFNTVSILFSFSLFSLSNVHSMIRLYSLKRLNRSCSSSIVH